MGKFVQKFKTHINLSFMSHVHWLAQVRRKGSYKGKVVGVSSKFESLPMDCCTVPGILLCICCFVAAKGLSASQVDACFDIVAKLESKMKISEQFKILPHFRRSHIQIHANKINLGDLKPVVAECSISWNRWALIENRFVEPILLDENSL